MMSESIIKNRAKAYKVAYKAAMKDVRKAADIYMTAYKIADVLKATKKITMDKIITISYDFLVRVPVEVDVKIIYNEDEIDEIEIINHRTDNIDYFDDGTLEESLYTNKKEYFEFLDIIKKTLE